MNRILRIGTSAALAGALVAAEIAPTLAYTQEQQWELAVGKQEYQTMQTKIVHSSPYYKILDPIAQRIAVVADRQYFMPFHFYLVNDGAPNAFSVPGGNVYVTMTMMTFVQNQQELAGVLCHETSHDIHHDVYNNSVKDQRLGTYAGILGALIGGSSGIAQSLIGEGANLEALTYSRAVESNADRTGAFTCAAAGENPWGMVWLMQRFATKPSGVPMEMLSDHPRDDHRVSDLESLFRQYPGTFGRFNSSVRTATPL